MEKVIFLNWIIDENEEDVPEDVAKYLVKEKKDYVDVIFIFKHKGKFAAEIGVGDGKKKHSVYSTVVKYNFESLEEWGDKRFDFTMDDYDIINKLQLESLSHTDFEFEAKN